MPIIVFDSAKIIKKKQITTAGTELKILNLLCLTVQK